jgi:hypothetical protein
MNIVNKGSMPSILRNWQIAIEHGGVSYAGTLPPTANGFTINFPNATPENEFPLSLTYDKSEEVKNKALQPIHVGSMLSGILFARFSNLDQSIFTQESIYKVTFQDVTGRQYVAIMAATAQRSPEVIAPGVRVKAICPITPSERFDYKEWLEFNLP